MSYRRLFTAFLTAIPLSIATAALAQFGPEQNVILYAITH